MFAAKNGHTESLKTLIEAGADVNAEDKYGNTALSYARGNGYTEIADLLKEAGAEK